MQPFACLPNHVTGKGMIKALKRKYPNANIVAVDYDPGASEVNQVNRIKLMLAAAFRNMEDCETETEAEVAAAAGQGYETAPVKATAADKASACIIPAVGKAAADEASAGKAPASGRKSTATQKHYGNGDPERFSG